MDNVHFLKPKNYTLTELAELESKFEMELKPQQAIECYEWSLKLNKPKSQWCVASVMGLFFKLFHRKYGFTWASSRGVYVQLNTRERFLIVDQAIEEHGARKIVNSIELLFSPQMEWVKNPDLIWLEPTKLKTHLLPALLQREKVNKCEYSEFKGPRPTSGWTVKRV